MMFVPALLFAAFAFYSAAFAANFFPRTRERTKTALCVFGLSLHTGAMWEIFMATKALPTSTVSELAELVGWFSGALAIAGFMFGIKAFRKMPLVAAAVFTVAPALCPHFAENVAGGGRASGIVIQVHAFFAALSYALMFAGSLAGAVYMRKYSAIKNKDCAGGDALGISLESLCKGIKRAMLWAAVAMGVSLALGFAGLAHADFDAAMWLKILAGLCVFALQVYIIANIALQNVKDVSLAKLSGVLTAVSILAFVPILARSILQ